MGNMAKTPCTFDTCIWAYYRPKIPMPAGNVSESYGFFINPYLRFHSGKPLWNEGRNMRPFFELENPFFLLEKHCCPLSPFHFHDRGLTCCKLSSMTIIPTPGETEARPVCTAQCNESGGANLMHSLQAVASPKQRCLGAAAIPPPDHIGITSADHAHQIDRQAGKAVLQDNFELVAAFV